MAIAPVPAFPFPRRPFSSITPFTYSDAMTHLELLEKLRVYAGVTLPAEINKVLDEYSIEITAEVQAAIDLMIGTLNDKIIEINDALADQQADYTQKIADLTAYVDDAVQQIINNSIEVQDPVVAGLINDAASDTGKALQQRLDGYVVKDSLVYNASDHGVIGSGTSDDTATMQALIDSVPDGATIVAPPGAVYRTNGWFVKDRTLNLDLSNAHLVKTSPANEIFRAEGSFDTPVGVAGVFTNQRYSRVVVADASGFNRGDVVKVFSNDEIVDARRRSETERSWQGEFAVIADIEGSDIHVSPPLLDTYSTNIRVARIQNHRVSFRFGTADYEGAQGTEWERRMFRFEVLNGSYISGHVVRGPGTAFGDRSCVYTVADLRVENLPAGDGYGVACGGSSWGDYRIVSNRLRHAFTDDTGGRWTIGQTDPANFGRAMYCKITGSSARSTSIPWDTHHGGYGHHFYDITATGSESEWQFRIRGRAHTLSNCIAIGATGGFSAWAESDLGGRGTSYQHRFVNCATYRVGQPFNVQKDTLDDPAFESVIIEGGYFEFFRQGPTITSGYMRLIDPVLVYTESDYEYVGSAFVNIVNGRLRGSFSLDATKIPGGASPSYILRGSTGPAGTNEIDVNVKLRLSPSARHEIQAVMEWNATRGQVTADVWGNHSMTPSWNITEDARTQRVTVTSFGAESGNNTAMFERTATSGGMLPIRSADPTITHRLNADSEVTIGGLEKGAMPGQMVVIYVLGGGSVTVPSSTGNANTLLLGGNPQTLATRDVLRLVWDQSVGSSGGAWVQV